MKVVFYTFLKGLFWTTLTAILGMLPVGASAFSTLFTKHSFITFEDTIRNGLSVGLVLALVGAVFVDQIFIKGTKPESAAQKLFFYGVPAFVILITGWSYMILELHPVDLDSKAGFDPLTIKLYKMMICVAALYCIAGKSIHFYPKTKEST